LAIKISHQKQVPIGRGKRALPQNKKGGGMLKACKKKKKKTLPET